MKKLLVLALVVSLTGLASAGLEWVSSAGSDVMPGQEIVLTLNATDGDEAIAVKIDLLTDNGKGGIMTGVTANAQFENGQVGMDAAAFDQFLQDNGAPAQGLDTGDWAFLDVFGGTSVVPQSENLIQVMYTVGDELGAVTIDTLGLEVLGGNDYVAIGTTKPSVPSVSLNVVPEPMTVALLGLGGLFLRRRK